MSVATETLPVACSRCGRTISVLVSNLFPPSFRHVEDQAECPELRELNGKDGAVPNLAVCDALKRSVKEKLESSEVGAVVHDDIWYVAHRAGGRPSALYSPRQARSQADIWDRSGRASLADQFRRAADQAERSQSGGGGGVEEKAHGTVMIYVMMIAVVGFATLYFVFRQAHLTPQTPGSAPVELMAAKPGQESTPAVAQINAPAPSLPAQSLVQPLGTQTALGAPALVPSPQRIAEPEMVALPGGTFAMGSNDDISEKPIHKVTVRPFAISKFPVTVREWNVCVAAKGCASMRSGSDDAPVANLSWDDAQQFIAWLAETTHKPFRLPSEAEWEYAARGGTATTYWWGDRLQVNMANCKGCGEPYDPKQPADANAVKPNPFGLYHMGGGVAQWVADCWHLNYRSAPADGSPWVDQANCFSRVIRSGSWRNEPSYIRPASRDRYDTSARYLTLGFRVAKSP